MAAFFRRWDQAARHRDRSLGLAVVLAALWWQLAATQPAQALEVILRDVAADRVERQRAFVRGNLPLPNTPDLQRLDERLKASGLEKGRAIYIRIFKKESELELWMQNSSGTFSLLSTYPICHWTGTIGPKLKEGDKQSPEGFYSVGVRQTRLLGRWRRAFNLGFPNLHDRMLSRTGSYILIHGGCSSVGCFAMTNPVQDEIYDLADAALSAGQKRFQVHIFPFRMTAANLAKHAGHEWAHTWTDLKPAYDSFERTQIPPQVVLCGPRYKVADGLPGETGGTERRLPVLRPPNPGDGPSDPTVVMDEFGEWAPPTCVLEDEAERRAAHRLATGELTTTGSIATPDAAVGNADTAGEQALNATLASEAVGQPASTPAKEAPQRKRRQQAKPEAGPSPSVDANGDGFGSALTGKGKLRPSASGG